MNYNNWKPTYHKILKDFHFKEKEDNISAKLLDSLLKNKSNYSIKDFNNLIKNKEIIIFGAGPSLENTINKNMKLFPKKILISANGATSALIKRQIFPHLIVTDLDGKIEDQIKANSKKSIIVVHAHGDNIDKIKQYVPRFNNRIIGTTQSDPKQFKNLHNFGGFTDGDRAIFLAEHFQAKHIYLIGFDFHGIIGKYSYPKKKDKSIKKQKLNWCKKFIQMLNEKYNNITIM